jgi:hypothetical protein
MVAAFSLGPVLPHVDILTDKQPHTIVSRIDLHSTSPKRNHHHHHHHHHFVVAYSSRKLTLLFKPLGPNLRSSRITASAVSNMCNKESLPAVSQQSPSSLPAAF